MYNWSVDENYLKKFPKQHLLWKLEQQISYGLDGEKLDKKLVMANWEILKKRLDPKRKESIEYFLWSKQS